MKRTFRLIIEVQKNGTKQLTKETSLELEGDAYIHATKARDIFQGLCRALTETLSDTEVERAVNNAAQKA